MWHHAQARGARSPQTAPHGPGCGMLSPKTPKGVTSTLRFLAAQGASLSPHLGEKAGCSVS